MMSRVGCEKEIFPYCGASTVEAPDVSIIEEYTGETCAMYMA
jgi:hypothetical protein